MLRSVRLPLPDNEPRREQQPGGNCRHRYPTAGERHDGTFPDRGPSQFARQFLLPFPLHRCQRGNRGKLFRTRVPVHHAQTFGQRPRASTAAGRVAKQLLQLAQRFGSLEGGSLRVTHDLLQRGLFTRQLDEGLQRLRAGQSRATERLGETP